MKKENIISSRRIAYRVEEDVCIVKDLAEENEVIEIEVKRQACRDDGVIAVNLEIDHMWCPVETGMGPDTRNLGLLITGIECIRVKNIEERI